MLVNSDTSACIYVYMSVPATSEEPTVLANMYINNLKLDAMRQCYAMVKGVQEAMGENNFPI